MTVIPSFTLQSLVGDIASSKALSSGWSWINEPVGISKKDAFVKPGLFEQINTTADKSDYLWYSLRYASLIILMSSVNMFSISGNPSVYFCQH